jgi:hypothetical protein
MQIQEERMIVEDLPRPRHSRPVRRLGTVFMELLH